MKDSEDRQGRNPILLTRHLTLDGKEGVMRIDIYVHHEQDPKLDQILTQLRYIAHKENVMSKELDELTAEVSRNTDVDRSAIILIQGIAKRLQDAGTDPVKLNALKSDLANSNAGLAAAVAENTPADPEVVPPPPPVDPVEPPFDPNA